MGTLTPVQGSKGDKDRVWCVSWSPKGSQVPLLLLPFLQVPLSPAVDQRRSWEYGNVKKTSGTVSPFWMSYTRGRLDASVGHQRVTSWLQLDLMQPLGYGNDMPQMTGDMCSSRTTRMMSCCIEGGGIGGTWEWSEVCGLASRRTADCHMRSRSSSVDMGSHRTIRLWMCGCQARTHTSTSQHINRKRT